MNDDKKFLHFFFFLRFIGFESSDRFRVELEISIT